MIIAIVLATTSLRAAPPDTSRHASLAPITARDTVIAAPPAGTFDLNKASGRLTILGWDRGDIRIRVVGANADPYDVVMSGSVISIRSRHARVPSQPSLAISGQNTRSTATVFRDGADRESEYEISVPRGMAGKAGGIGADVTISGTRGSVDAVVINGRLSVDDVAGTVTLRSLNGQVSARHVSGTLSILSPNEHVTVEDMSGDLTVRSVNGGITVTRAQLVACDVRTYNGSIRMWTTLGERGPFTLSTFNGDVELRLSGRADLSISAAVSDGNLSLPPGASLTSVKAGKRSTLVLGKGRGPLLAETFHGNIMIGEGKSP